jgi:hypothetical protein
MTFIFVNVMRDGKWVNLEIDDLTDEEIEALAVSHPDKGWMWASALIKWIRDSLP